MRRKVEEWWRGGDWLVRVVTGYQISVIRYQEAKKRAVRRGLGRVTIPPLRAARDANLRSG